MQVARDGDRRGMPVPADRARHEMPRSDESTAR
jgi:hypothetical protein